MIVARSNAKEKTARPFCSSSEESCWPSVEEMAGVPMRNQSLKLGLETCSVPHQHVVRQLVTVVNEMPMPALLLTQTGRILTVNSGVRSLISHVEGSGIWRNAQRLWAVLGWPAVPFCHWHWRGTVVSSWDCVLGRSADMPGLKIRYVSAEIKEDGDRQARQQRLAILGQEVMRVVHDLRNPLTSLEWFATLLGKDGQAFHERKEMVDHLVNAIRTLDGSLANLLIFAKPIHVERQRCRISRLLSEVEWMAVHPLRQKGIIIRRLVEPGLEEVCGDEHLLIRAVLNVVLNAIHVSPSGGRIEIVCQRVVRPEAGHSPGKDRPSIQIMVRDFGCGIPREEVNMIFSPFFSKRKGGTGLGLSIVKHIMSAHHGLITVHSEHGKGTTVCLVLPQ